MALLRQAARAFHAGEKQTARNLLSEASEINPRNELVWLWRASAARTRWEALEAVERVLDLNPANDKALQWLGRLRPQGAALREVVAEPVRAMPVVAAPVEERADEAETGPAEASRAEAIQAEASPAEANEIEAEAAWAPTNELVATPSSVLEGGVLEELEEDDDPIRRLLAGRGGYDPDLDGDDAIEDSLAALERSRAEPEPAEAAGLDDGEAEGDVWSALGVAPPEARNPSPAAELETLAEPAPPAEPEAAWRPAAEPPVPAPKPWECFVCGKMGGNQEGVCIFCRSIVDLERMDQAARHEGTDRSQLIVALERTLDALEAHPTAEGHVQAALLRLNLRESNAALPHLLAACRLRPDDAGLRAAYERLAARPLILAVDDSKTVQKMISTVLEKERYRVVTAEDGLQALARLDDELPSLVLLDITMPRMDGYQVCKVITGNEATRHIPVVMLSGKDGFFDKVRGKMVGASNYLTKPFDPEQLTATIAKFLRKD